MPRARVLALTPETHRPHLLHGGQRDWVESNCYLDLWIELLHALDLEPLAGLGFALASDFEGDQWTFSKPGNLDLVPLYGLCVEELSVWRDLEEHCVCHLELGQLPLLEVDAYYLPDVVQTDYRVNHVKTTIAVCAIDTDSQHLDYLHNAGCFRVHGADYRGLLGLDWSESVRLPPYCEIVKLHRRVDRPDQELRAIAHRQAAMHVARGPESNPVRRFATAFPDQIQRIVHEGEGAYHRYAFAMLRQLGAASEYAVLHLRWLAGSGDALLSSAADAHQELSGAAKLLLLRTARMVARGTVSDVSGTLDAMADAWDRAWSALQRRFGS